LESQAFLFFVVSGLKDLNFVSSVCVLTDRNRILLQILFFDLRIKKSDI
jgi:hypothetical protein